MCLRLRDHGAVNAALWQQLLALFGAKQAVELLVICGIYRCVLGLAGTPTVNAADGRVDEAGLPQPGIARVASG